jgi:hypothetical protein
MKYIAVVLVLCVLAMFTAAAVHAADLTVFETKKHGYSIKMPVEFKMDGSEDKTTTWSFQPGSAPVEAAQPAPAPKEGKKKGLGGLVKGAAGGLTGGKVKTEAPAAETAAPKQELEPALSIYVNWVWMPDVPSATLFESNKKSDMQNIKSPDPDYKDLVVMDKKNGYAIEGGSAYWYKEKDKSDPAAIHRWHIKAFGNKSAYTIGLCGTYRQFEKWGPVYEQVIKSFKLIPLEGNK